MEEEAIVVKTTVSAGLAAAIALAVGGLVGVGEATEASTGNGPVRAVSVEGVASVPIGATASAATANGTYRRALAEAVADGLSKAQLLAEKTASSVGAIQTVSEGSGSIECPEGVEYEGVMPDFGQGGSVYGAPGAVSGAGAVSPRTAPKRKSAPKRPRRQRPQAKKANVTGCALSARVGLVYQLG
jgi:hypothetical protein